MIVPRLCTRSRTRSANIIACSVLRVRMETYTIEILPFLLAMFVVLGLITFVPWFSLALPNWTFGPG